MLKPWKLWERFWRKRQERSGITQNLSDSHVREASILAVLGRQVEFNALDALIYAYKPEPNDIDLAKVALAFDSSAFLRIASQADIVDYLHSRHPAPIILPGQAIQEFWNNNLNVTDSIATGINKKFEELKKEVIKVDSSFHDFSVKFSVLIEEFRASFGYAYDGGTVRRTMSFFEILREKAMISYVRREPFAALATHRKRTKTPPGFKDEGDGDFFIWLDMLDALLLAKSNSILFEKVVLVSNDKKLDWSREGIAHPILSAEIAALIGVPFEMWDVSKLAQKVAEASE